MHGYGSRSSGTECNPYLRAGGLSCESSDDPGTPTRVVHSRAWLQLFEFLQLDEREVSLW